MHYRYLEKKKKRGILFTNHNTIKVNSFIYSIQYNKNHNKYTNTYFNAWSTNTDRGFALRASCFVKFFFGTRDFDRFVEEEELRRIYPAFLASYDRVYFFNFNEKKKLQPPGEKIKLAAKKTSESDRAIKHADRQTKKQMRRRAIPLEPSSSTLIYRLITLMNMKLRLVICTFVV